MVILSAKEQEYLLHALDTAHAIRELRQFYLWSQGALQALLPHRVLLCVRLDGEGRVARIDCLHSAWLEQGARQHLCDATAGPVPALLRQWRQGGARPLALDVAALGHDAPGHDARQLPFPISGQTLAQDLDLGTAQHPVPNLWQNLGHGLVHGSGPLPGCASAFVLLGLPFQAAARQQWLLQLLLPCLHLALQRIAATDLGVPPDAGAPAVSPRQAEILRALREGKSNEEIGAGLGISALTVKNHLQRLYRQLGASNRAHAVALCAALKFD